MLREGDDAVQAQAGLSAEYGRTRSLKLSVVAGLRAGEDEVGGQELGVGRRTSAVMVEVFTHSLHELLQRLSYTLKVTTYPGSPAKAWLSETPCSDPNE